MVIKVFIFCIIIFLVFLLTYNNTQDNLPFTENVLTNGIKITVDTPKERLIIEGKKGTKRFFKGKGWSKTSILTPRTVRWYGSLGLYDPADSNIQNGRVLVDEGRQFFSNKNEALRYICRRKEIVEYLQNGTLVYNNNGLVVSYEINHYDDGDIVRCINIWQIYIDGEKPTSLKGANDSAIRVSGGTIPNTAIAHPAKIGEPRKICSEEKFGKSSYWQ